MVKRKCIQCFGGVFYRSLIDPFDTLFNSNVCLVFVQLTHPLVIGIKVTHYYCIGLICGVRSIQQYFSYETGSPWVWYICVRSYKVFLVDCSSHEYGASFALLTSFGVKSMLLDITTPVLPASGSVYQKQLCHPFTLRKGLLLCEVIVGGNKKMNTVF